MSKIFCAAIDKKLIFIEQCLLNNTKVITLTENGEYHLIN